MSKTCSEDWVVIANAAFDARHALRSRILPQCDELARLLPNGQAAALLSAIRDEACDAAVRLRFALKERGNNRCLLH